MIRAELSGNEPPASAGCHRRFVAGHRRPAYKSVGEARSSIGRYLDFYNTKRPHQSLDGATPDQAYFTELPLRAAA